MMKKINNKEKSRPTQRKMKKSLPSCFFFFSSPFPVTNLTIPFFWPGSATVPTCAALPLFGQGILKKGKELGCATGKGFHSKKVASLRSARFFLYIFLLCV